jgi:hypothetical protein
VILAEDVVDGVRIPTLDLAHPSILGDRLRLAPEFRASRT